MEFEKKVVELDVNDVLPNRFQPRIKFNEDSINELSESIKEHGVIQPIVVRAMGDKYEIIAGERRYKASLLAGKQTIPAIITDLNDKDSAEVALIENVQRKDLTPIEEAISYKKILDMGYLTQEELANKLGKNQGTVANKLRLLNLDDEVQEAVLEERISERHARSLLKLKDKKQQVEMLNNIIENRLTVRKTDEAIANLLNENNVEMIKEMPVIINDVEESNLVKVNETLLEERGVNGMIEEFNPFKIEEPSKVDNVMPIAEPYVAEKIEAPITGAFEAPSFDVNANVINPGFMDINNIEANAKDIRVEVPIADMNSLLTPIDMPKVEEQPTFTSVEPVEPTVDLSNNRFFSIPNIEPVTKPEPVVEPEKSIDELFTMNGQPLVSQVNENVQNVGNQSELFNFNFDNSFTKLPEMPTVENNIEIPTVESITDVNLNQTTEMPETMSLDSVVLPIEDSLHSSNMIDTLTMQENISSAIPEPVISNQVPVNNRIIEALNIVRNCSKELENLGFSIDVEEIDFENLYQFIIKIQK